MCISSSKCIFLVFNQFDSTKPIHTYIIGHYNLSVRIIDLVSHIIYVLCVNSERQIFFFMASLFTLRVFARNLLRGYSRRNTFRVSFWCLAWDSNPGFSSNKPTHYLLDHGDFTNNSTSWKKTLNGGPYIFTTTFYH